MMIYVQQQIVNTSFIPHAGIEDILNCIVDIQIHTRKMTSQSSQLVSTNERAEDHLKTFIVHFTEE